MVFGSERRPNSYRGRVITEGADGFTPDEMRNRVRSLLGYLDALESGARDGFSELSAERDVVLRPRDVRPPWVAGPTDDDPDTWISSADVLEAAGQDESSTEDAVLTALRRARGQLSREKDSTSLLWGFGLVRLAPLASAAALPTITVELDIDYDGASYSLVPRRGPERNVWLLKLLGIDPDHEALSVIDDDFDVWATEEVERLKNELIALAASTAAKPLASDADEWIVYLERRDLEAEQSFLRAVRRIVDEGGEISSALQVIVGASAPKLLAPPVERLLLPRPANPEQLRIIKRSCEEPAVVVQGPPGTGKTHTIANLIALSLSRGERVLVTAQKEQALQALREKIPTSIERLAVVWVGSDADARRALKDSVAEILRQANADDAERRRERRRLQDELQRIERLISSVEDGLRRERLREAAPTPFDEKVTIHVPSGGGVGW